MRATCVRSQSGDLCFETGWYAFDGYIEAPGAPPPGLTEQTVWLRVGDVFPALQRPRTACRWRLLERTAEPHEGE